MRRKQITVIFFVLAAVAVGILLPRLAGAFSGHGLGSATYPFRITSCEQLQEVENNLSAHYALMSDIDCNDTHTIGQPLYSGGAGFASISQFQGSFDGRNHTIDGLTVVKTGINSGNGGLFNQLIGATVKNVKFTDLSVTATGGQFTGGLAGNVANNTTVSHVSVAGTVHGNIVVGGLIGRADNGVVITSTSFTGAVSDDLDILGGLVGQMLDSSITDSYVNATLEAANTSAGLVSQIFTSAGATSITNSYATGTVHGHNYRAGVIQSVASEHGAVTINNVFSTMLVTFDGTAVSSFGGVVARDSTAETTPVVLTNVVYDDSRSASPNNCVAGAAHDGCSSVTTDSQFKGLSAADNVPFVGHWDFDGVWQANNGYPSLREASLEPLENLTAPSNPNFTIITPGPDNIQASWIPPGDDYLGGEPIIGYHLSYSLAGQNSWTTIDLDASTTSYNITGLTSGESYDLLISAENAVGVGSMGGQNNIHIFNPNISTCRDLQNISSSPDSDYVLVNDINCSATAISDPDDPNYNADLYNNGEGFVPIEDFTGTLSGDDGNGGSYTISNLTINRPEDWFQGMFANAYNGAYIHDLNISGINVTGALSVGGLMASANGEVVVDTIEINGSIQGAEGVSLVASGVYGVDGFAPSFSNINAVGNLLTLPGVDGQFFGGIAGYVGGDANGGNFNFSNITGNIVSVNSEEEVNDIGGMIGQVSIVESARVDITDSEVQGDLYGTNNVGGIIGSYLGNRDGAFPEVHIENVKSWSEMGAQSDAGGFVGEMNAGYGARLFITDSVYETLDEQLAYGIYVQEGEAGGLVGAAYQESDGYIEVHSSYVKTGIGNNIGDVGGMFGHMELAQSVSDSYADVYLLGGGNVGGIAGSSVATTADNVYTLGVGFNTGGAIGGLFGSLENGFVSDSFTALSPNSDSGTAAALIGTGFMPNLTLSNLWYDQYQTYQSECYYDTDIAQYVSNESCNVVNFNNEGDQSDPDYFKQNSSNPPLSEWDFSDVWGTTAAEGYGYPVLRANPQAEIEDPIVYNITDCQQLQGMQRDLGGDFTLANDIDCYETTGWHNDGNGAQGFEPVGTEAEPFTGTLNGYGHSINGLWINRENENNVGLFGVTTGASIRSFNLGGEADIRGGENVGQVTGIMHGGTLRNIKGQVFSVTGTRVVGGLVGFATCADGEADLDLFNVRNYANTSIEDEIVGGIVGQFESAGSDCDAVLSRAKNYGNVGSSSNETFIAGGLVGLSNSVAGNLVIQDSRNDAFVLAETSTAGGLVGSVYRDPGASLPQLLRNTSSGDTMARAEGAGGIVGYVDNGIYIYQNVSSGQVMGNSGVGGLVGVLYGHSFSPDISQSYATGNVSSGENEAGDTYGGLVGFGQDAIITDSFASNSVFAEGAPLVGGIAGHYSGDIINSYSDGSITGGGPTGGIVGYYTGTSTDTPVGLSHNFSTAFLDGTPGQTAGIAGRTDYPSLLLYDYFDSGRTSGWSYCAYDTNGDPAVTPACEAYNLDATGPDLFLDNSTIPPFQMPPEDSSQVWDFDSIWTTKDQDHPKLRWAYTRPVASITNCQELQAMRFVPDGDYVLNGPEGEIDCRDTPFWNAGDGFLPVGDENTPFTGTLEGNGNTILGLSISSEDENVGMFGVVQDASISNLVLSTANDSGIGSPATNTNVGALAGTVLGGTTIDSIQALTPVNTAGSSIGGLVGQVFCETDGSSISITDSVTQWFLGYRSSGEGNYGGLIGFVGSTADCPVTVAGSSSLGFMGYTGSGSYGGEDVGSLIGYIYSDSAAITIDDNYGSANINNAASTAGGLVGAYYDNSGLLTGVPQIHITNNVSDANVTVSGEGSSVGGLVGAAWGGTISDSSAIGGTITGGGSIGGLVGALYGDNQTAQVARSLSDNTVSSNNTAGGLVGEAADTRIEDSYSKSVVHATSGTAGGLVGVLSGDAVNSYASGIVAADTAASEIGGLVGRYNGSATDQHDALLHNFSATTFEFDHSGVPNIGGIAGNFTDTDGFNLNTNFYDEDRAATSICAWVAFGSPDTLSCDTRSYTTFQGNDSENPFVIDGDRNWDFNSIWSVVNEDFPALQQNGPEIAHTITNCLELQAMQDDLSGNFILANDISCHDADTPNDSYTWNEGQGFLPVGNNDLPFTGTFNGQNHTISGLYINSSSDYDAGLFGNTTGATIQNVIFDDSLAGSNTGATGMVTGSAFDTTITRVGVEDSIVGSNYENSNPTGGIVGIIFGNLTGEAESTSTIRESYVHNIDMSAGNYEGGLAGVSVGAVIIDSYASDSLINGNSQVGGLVGVNAEGVVVSSYAALQMIAHDSMGGIAGNNDNGIVALSFAAVNMNPAEDGFAIGGLVGAENGGLFDSYYDQAVTGPFSCSDSIDECGGTAVNEDGTDSAHFFNNTTVPPFDAGSPFWNFEDVWHTRTSDYPVLRWADQTAPVYDITTCAQLQNINENLAGNYRLMNDIDCSGSAELNSGDGFSPIGRGEGLAFTGELDGQGHSINQLFIYSWSDAGNVGLFGQTNEGAYIHDLAISGLVEGESSVGAVVGHSYGDTNIERVANNMVVLASDDYVGGLVGLSEGSISIVDSYNQALVQGSRYIGGLLGFTDDEAEIHKSYNSGDISGMGNIGGIAGVVEYGTIDSTFNAGLVEAGNDRAAIVNTVGEVYFHNNYVDADRTEVDNCINNVGNEECHVVNTNESPDESYFFDNATNAPFSLEGSANWDFDGTWLSHRGRFPTLGVRSNYTITNCSELTAINNDLNGSYKLANNIGPCGFTPLAQSEPFTGVLDGDGYTIDGLTLYGGYPKALFGFAENASVRDLTINDVSTSGAGCGGALFGQADGFDIYNVHVNGDINTEIAGGLVGCIYSSSGNRANIEKSSYGGSVAGLDGSGGLVGQSVLSNGSTLTVSESSSLGSIAGRDSCGGLLGPVDYEWDGLYTRQAIAITKSWSDATILCEGSTGGLVSEILANGLDLTISQSHFSGSIDANNGDNVGGLLGAYNTNGHTPFLYITESYVEADITNGGWYVGGILGLLPSSTAMYMNNVYYKGNIDMTGSRGGGLIGETSAAYDRFEIASAYAAGSITSTNPDDIGVPWTGGLVGAMQQGGYISSSFAAMDVTTFNIDTFLAGGLVGDANLANTHFYNDYYNSDTGTGHCAYGDDDYIVDEQCQGVSLNDFPDMWRANDQDVPLDGWNFGETWHIRTNDYPSLSPAIEPEVQCRQVSTTTTSLHATCNFFTIDGMLYGPTTWEMRYSVLGTNDWRAVELGSEPYFDQTISGLQPNTQYRIEFRYTDDRGVSEWLRIDATTNQADDSQPTGQNSKPGTSLPLTPQTTARQPRTNSAVIIPVAAPDQKIILNDFTDYLSGNGKRLALKVGQVIYFMVGDQEHSATVKEIGADYVILMWDSTQQTVKLTVGQVGTYDVTNDNTVDIQMTLSKIEDSTAYITFKQISHLAGNTKTANHTTYWLLWITIGTIILGGIVVGKHRSAKNKDNAGTT